MMATEATGTANNSSTTVLLQVNDPVYVITTTNSGAQQHQFEGVICFVGAVPELSSKNEGEGGVGGGGAGTNTSNDCYYGIRLTGPSVGQGTNDGSIQQHKYFDCPTNCGMFVPTTDSESTTTVTKRNLTRLEILRLRRELASSSSSSSSSSTATISTTGSNAIPTMTTTTTTATGRLTPPRESSLPSSSSLSSSITAISTPSLTPIVSDTVGTSTTTAATISSSSASAAAKAKLEEIKMRREALKLQHQQKASSVDTSTAGSSNDQSISGTPTKTAISTIRSPQPLSSNTTTTKLQQQPDDNDQQQWKVQINDLTNQLAMRDQENMDLKKNVISLKDENEKHKLQMMELQQKLDAVSSQKVATTTSTGSSLSSSHDTTEIEKIQKENLKLQSTYDEMKDQMLTLQQELGVCQKELHKQRASNETTMVELTRARAEVTSYQNQIREQHDQTDQRNMSDAIHYKERAKLSADISALKRKVDQLEKEKMDLEAAIEDITLDKEQLQEEKDIIEEKFEELKLDAETAQMEVEELRIELDDAKATASRVTSVSETLTTAAIASAGSPSKMLPDQSPDTIEMIQSLQTQNARLREALIRLREQSALEKMELTRQLRSVEKIVESNTAVQGRVDELSSINQNLNEQINDLKDMVEQGAAFESMVEDLSDRIMMMEEQNVVSNTIIRELEEAAELTAEMEEVQADELKALSRDVEARDTIIRNLEEAIKMQRRREDDLRRTVGNYKSTVDTLRQENQALLELQQGGEGEKNSLVQSSQKALSRAAQLVSEAAIMRKREAIAASDRINRIMYSHLSNRLESMLPQSVVSIELSSVKGEIIASTVSCKAANLLAGIYATFRKSIRPPLPSSSQDTTLTSEPLTIQIPDELQQELRTTFHHADFAHVISTVAAEIIRFIAAGQWPDLLSTEESTELGTILGHSMAELDESLGALLKTFKEEGSLAIEQSSVGALQLSFQNTMHNLRADIEKEDKLLVESSWNPPGWSLLRDITFAKYDCLGVSSALSLVLDSKTQNNSTQTALHGLYNIAEQCSSFASSASFQLRNVDITDTIQVGQLSAICGDFVREARILMSAVRELLMSSGDIANSIAAGNSTLRAINNFGMELRSKNINVSDDDIYHPLSPEFEDPWSGICHLVRSIRSVDNDSEDVNFLLRSRGIEKHLGEAVENESKLEWATNRISYLEKTLLSKTKEFAMQSARLSELENLMAKSSAASFGRGTDIDFKTSAEFKNLQEENRVLTEAIDVLQREVEKYENEIRSLKDFKSPKRGSTPGSRATPMKSTAVGGNTPSYRGLVDDSHSSISLEATLFRPALQQALQDAAHWKAVATGAALQDLPPLPNFPLESNVPEGDSILLSTTVAKARIEKAKISLVNLKNKDKPPRTQLREMKARNAAIAESLETALLRYRGITTTYRIL